jgi:hypothetical protein
VYKLDLVRVRGEWEGFRCAQRSGEASEDSNEKEPREGTENSVEDKVVCKNGH